MSQHDTQHDEILAPNAARRRTMLKAAGGALTLGTVAGIFGATLPRGAFAKDAVAGGRCLTILYPKAADTKFNFDYYRDHHLKLIMDLFGNAIQRFELRKVLSPEGAPPADFVASINIWVGDQQKFDEGGQKHGPKMIEDVPNFTNAQPVIQTDEIIGMAGSASSSTKVGQRCLAIAYPNSDGVKFDTNYYRDHHMPLIMKLYGADAIHRFELRRGVAAQDGSTAPYVGSINIYIAKQDAFDKAGTQHGQTLRDDVPNFSSVNPIALTTEIVALAQT
jgi:uncharacterized protein (TIGR02118 family)